MAYCKLKTENLSRFTRTKKGNRKISGGLPAGRKVKSAIFFSIFLIILSRPLAKNVPELVRTLLIEGRGKRKKGGQP